MPTHQGSTALLDDPVARQLLHSTVPARFAYNWRDGTPRVVPIWFHWNGTELVLCSPPGAPKLAVLRTGARVAVTIDTDTMPYKTLLIRGPIRTDLFHGIPPEYEAAAHRVLGEQAGNAWLATMGSITSRVARIFVRPDWVAVLDFEARYPSAVERAMEHAAARSA